MKKNFKTGLIVLIVLVLAVAGISIFSYVKPVSKASVKIEGFNPNSSISKISSSDAKNKSKAVKNYKHQFIAAVYIEGTIEEANNEYNQKWLMSTIQSLKDNPKNVAMAVYINSPGGTVYQADEVYLALQDYKTTGKPVYVYQGSMAASGGYYISCAGDKIYANRNTLTGCIGVLMGTSYDLTGLFDNLGIKSITVHSGKNKNMMNYNEPFTEEQQAIMQSMCDECYEQFVSIVVNRRLISFQKAYELSDGRLYTAKQALENGLIDGIDSWDNMIDTLSENELNMPDIQVKDFKYEGKSKSVLSLLLGKAQNIENTKAATALGIPEKVLEDINKSSMVPMYLCK